MPGRDLFGSVGSYQHHGRNPDWGPIGGAVIFSARRSRIWPSVGPVPPAEGRPDSRSAFGLGGYGTVKKAALFPAT